MIGQEVFSIIHSNEWLTEKSNVAVDTLILSVKVQESLNYRKLPQKKLCVLLVKSEDETVWQIPKNYKKKEESLDEAALRILEAGFEGRDLYIEQLYTFSDANNMGNSEINVSYMILTSQMNLEGRQSDKKLNYKWFEITFVNLAAKLSVEDFGDLPYTTRHEIILRSLEDVHEAVGVMIEVDRVTKNQEIGNTLNIIKTEKINHIDSKILAYGIERLRNKIEYTDILFHLMPECFTLTELQQVQELILDEKMYTAHFRRKIEPKLVKCVNQVIIAKGHRPAQQYTYNPKWNCKTRLGGSK